MSKEVGKEVAILDKTKFVENIQKWVVIDTQIKRINEKMQEIRKNKSELVGEITEYVTKNGLNNATVEISDGELTFVEKREYPALTYSYLEECLSEIMSDKKQIQYILQYMKDNRKIKTAMEIKRTTAVSQKMQKIAK
jgi:hypothetical protein